MQGRHTLAPATQQRPYKMDSWDREASCHVTRTSTTNSHPFRQTEKDGNPALIFFRRQCGKQLQKLVSGEMMIESKLGA